MMERTPFLPLPEGMLIEQVQLTENGLLITVIATRPTSRCPLCSECSSSIHSTYHRRLEEDRAGRLGEQKRDLLHHLEGELIAEVEKDKDTSGERLLIRHMVSFRQKYT